MLVGRHTELARLREVLDSACAGHAQALRLVGPPGIGKTTLLDAARLEARDRGMTVVSLVGLEIEQRLPRAGLDVLIRSLGSDETRSPGGLLAAIAAASSTRPLLVVLDDAQWLDPPSLGSLAFAARRLLADPVALLVAGRPGTDELPELAGLPRVEVGPLSPAEGVAMLRMVDPRMPESVATRVTAAFAGVPLALRDVAALLPDDVLRGVAPVPSPVPVSAAVQARYARGLQNLPPRTRSAVVLLATDSTGRQEVVTGALERRGLSVADLAPASDLVRTLPTLSFVHPLARAAAHSLGAPEDRRASDQAIADELAHRGDRVGALRHRAASTNPPDPDLAAELEALAHDLAVNPFTRGDAAQAALLAARFCADHRERVRLALLAAECSGAEAALAIVADLETDPWLTPDDRARCLFVRLEHDVDLAAASGLDALDDLDDASLTAPVRARAELWRVWQASDSLNLTALGNVAQRIEASAGSDTPWQVLAAGGIAFTFLGQHRHGVALLRRAESVTASLDPRTLSPNELSDWAVIPGWLGERDTEHARRFRRMDRILRATGNPEAVTTAAFFSAERARREGLWGRASALLQEAIDVSAANGVADVVSQARLACLHAYRGDGERVQALVAEAREGLLMGSPWGATWLDQAVGALHLTLGRPDQAAEVLTGVRELPFVGRGARDAIAASLVDLVEALAALGESEAAAAAAADLAGRLDGVVDPFGTAVVARCWALAEPDSADTLLRQALASLAETTEVFETARTELLLGEHLRRTRRPRLARAPLGRALAAFHALGAEPWAARARHELAASGDRHESGPGGPAPSLTAQEARVAMAVADGLTNAEVAQSLFLSVKTVEFHLGRVYRKLDVRSRGGLARALGDLGLTHR